MGVPVRGPNNRRQNPTDGLEVWITKVRVKKNSFKRQRRKNLRVEAVLTSALVKAEMLLRMKQQQRYQRWQRIKTELFKADCNVCNITAVGDRSTEWDEKTCEDLDSLHSFMCLVNEVKCPVQRWTHGQFSIKYKFFFLWYYWGIFSFQSLHLRRHVCRRSTSGVRWQAMMSDLSLGIISLVCNW